MSTDEMMAHVDEMMFQMENCTQPDMYSESDTERHSELVDVVDLVFGGVHEKAESVEAALAEAYSAAAAKSKAQTAAAVVLEEELSEATAYAASLKSRTEILEVTVSTMEEMRQFDREALDEERALANACHDRYATARVTIQELRAERDALLVRVGKAEAAPVGLGFAAVACAAVASAVAAWMANDFLSVAGHDS